MARLQDFSGLARAVDFHYPTNRAIAGLTVLAFVGMLVYTGDPHDALRGAVALFLAWALSRELDPDRDGSAFLAAGFVVPFLGWGAEGPLFWTLLAVRAVNRTSGVPPNPLDMALLLWLAYPNPYLLMLSALALALDGRKLAWGGSLIALALTAFTGPVSLSWHALLAVPCFLLLPPVRSARTDVDDQPLDPRRVQMGRLLAVLAAAAAPGWQMMPLCAAFVGSALYRQSRPPFF